MERRAHKELEIDGLMIGYVVGEGKDLQLRLLID